MFKKLFLSMCFVLLCSSLAMAVPYTWIGNTDTLNGISWDGSTEGNHQDAIENVNKLVELYNDDIDNSYIPEGLFLLDEYEVLPPPDGVIGALVWDINSDTEYISFKYNGDFELWYIGDASLYTENDPFVWISPNMHELSHYRTWTTDPLGGVAPVPEPATMFLLGTGLLGIGAVSRKKMFKK
jgi:hypothetical protein